MAEREYQRQAEDAAFNEWDNGVRSTLIVAPTGSGKSIIAARIINRIQPKRTLFLAHREELIFQARERVREATGLETEIEMAELSVSPNLFGAAPVIAATVQTLNSKNGTNARIRKFKPEDFGLVIVDEAHRGVCATYKNVLNYFQQNPDLKVLGITASPSRLDEQALGQIFESVCFDYEIRDAIKDGWLVPVEQQMVNIKGLDFSHVRTTAGDLNSGDLAAVMEEEENMQGVTGAALDVIKSKRAIVFTVSVRQAEVGADIFNRHISGMAAWICGTTPKDKRREILAQHKSGLIQVVFNCQCLIEGYDDPGVEVIVMAAPTKSQGRYLQMAGRCMRPLPGVVDDLPDSIARRFAIAQSRKPHCLILDFAGNSGRHKLITTADILGGKYSDDAIERANKLAAKLGRPVDMVEALEDAEKDIHEEIERHKREEEARKARLVAKVKYSSRVINPFDAFQLDPVKVRGWDQGKVLSEKQRGVLMRMGVNPDTYPYAQARQLLNEQFRRWREKLATVKQCSLLQKHGYETKDLKMDEASRLIDALAKNHWRRPADPAPEPQPAAASSSTWDDGSPMEDI